MRAHTRTDTHPHAHTSRIVHHSDWYIRHIKVSARIYSSATSLPHYTGQKNGNDEWRMNAVAYPKLLAKLCSRHTSPQHKWLQPHYTFCIITPRHITKCFPLATELRPVLWNTNTTKPRSESEPQVVVLKWIPHNWVEFYNNAYLLCLIAFDQAIILRHERFHFSFQYFDRARKDSLPQKKKGAAVQAVQWFP